MLSDHMIVLVSGDELHEAHVPASMLMAASPVWHERLAIAPPTAKDDTTRSVEVGVSQMELDSFVGCLTLFSCVSTMPSLLAKPRPKPSSSAHLSVRRLTAALTLTHKYECHGTCKLIAHLADAHFPKCSFTAAGASNRRPPIEHHRHDDDQRDVKTLSSWITQAHLDYIMRAQELFPTECHELLNDTCLELLAHALSSPCGVQWSTCTRFANGYHFQHGSIAVVDRLPSPTEEEHAEDGTSSSSQAAVVDEVPYSVSRHTYDATSASLHMFLKPFTLETYRLQQPIMMRLIHYLRPRNQIRIVTEIFDRADEVASPGAELPEPTQPRTASMEPGEILWP